MVLHGMVLAVTTFVALTSGSRLVSSLLYASRALPHLPLRALTWRCRVARTLETAGRRTLARRGRRRRLARFAFACGRSRRHRRETAVNARIVDIHQAWVLAHERFQRPDEYIGAIAGCFDERRGACRFPGRDQIDAAAIPWIEIPALRRAGADPWSLPLVDVRDAVRIEWRQCVRCFEEHPPS